MLNRPDNGSFAVAGPKLWNSLLSLLVHLRQTDLSLGHYDVH